MHVTIHIDGRPDEIISPTDTALALPRVTFNPSGDQHVITIKALAAALATEIERVRDSVPGAAETAQEALSMLRTASMTAVYAATTPKP